jgi:phage tail-like protein
MRSSVDGLATPYPLATLLPAFMQEDSFAVRLTTGLDDVIAPVISVLDCLDAYVDPLLAPSDFVTWLAGWVGAPLDDNWDDALRRREVLASAVLYRMRGTLEGLRAQVALATDGEVEIYEPGGTSWSLAPTEAKAGEEPQELVVRVAVAQPESVRLAALEELVAAAKPAHLPHRIEVVSA